MIERISSSQEQELDKLFLRPDTFSSFIGQNSLKENLQVFIQAARQRKEPLDHALLSGPPGLGKTTLAHIIAKEMQANIKATSAPIIDKTGDMAALLSGLEKGDVLFIDEIHRLRPVVEEVLYSAMEDYSLDITIGQGITSKSVKVSIPPFTFVGATTRPGSLTQPLLSRFGILLQFEYYQIQDLKQILKNNAKKMGIAISEDGLQEIAKRSRGTPRILNRLLKRVRDFAQIQNKDILDKGIADFALNKLKIDSQGLDELDRKFLRVLIEHFGGGPVGLDNMAISLSEDPTTIEDVIEPYLIQQGFIKRAPRGRIAAAKAYKYLDLKHAPDLFDYPDY